MQVSIPEALTRPLQFGNVDQIRALRHYEAELAKQEELSQPGTFRVTIEVGGSITRTVQARSASDAEQKATDGIDLEAFELEVYVERVNE